jgi:hypothetical protein
VTYGNEGPEAEENAEKVGLPIVERKPGAEAPAFTKLFRRAKALRSHRKTKVGLFGSVVPSSGLPLALLPRYNRNRPNDGRVAQWIEHQPSKLTVAGSSPASLTTSLPTSMDAVSMRRHGIR